ncbi:DUF1992 domain-containing protein [Ornithinibacillus gellani]|uniref:DnaJ family domain-containing protein n=1 Tax=Ornithinibacillus gellani TaxID=2293253 RepID=UPI000F476233|nr:DnaJ family domain-containing protein [Ornithinibacillus gellani]TQS70533.1 DUF1992 domain-containing protein [Ornithinibacillus gellani]
MDRKYNDLIGDILSERGEKDNYKGKGKGKPLPKNYMEKDLFQNFQEKAKEAGYLPAWLTLQKEIAALVQEAVTAEDVGIINEQIKKYNSLCPPPMQKPPINIDRLEYAKKVWR